MASLGVVARASGQVEPIHVVYRVPADCPDESRFLGEVRGRTRRVRIAPMNLPARLFAVTVTTNGNLRSGVLEIDGTDGTVTRREVSGSDCAAVIAALALMTSLAVDPYATSASSPSDDTPSVGQGADRTEAPSAVEPRNGPPKPPGAADDRPHPDAPERADEATSPEQPGTTVPARISAPWRWVAGAEGAAVAGLLPTVGLGGGAFAETASPWLGAWAVSFRISAMAAEANATFSSGVAARLFWLVARVEGCPRRLRLASPVALGVCLAFDAGAVRSSGGGLLATEASDTHPWLAPGALARASWTLPGRVRLEASGGPSVPLVRYGLNYGDTASGATVLAYRLPAVAVATAVGVGYAFP